MTRRLVTLGEVCSQDRTSVRPGHADELAYLGLEGIESGTGRFLDGELSKTPEVPQANSFRFDERHVLYGKLRPYLNKVAVPTAPGKCSTEIIPLLPSAQLDRRYLSYFLRAPATVKKVAERSSGARMPRADMDFVLSLPIGLPAMEEQRRIVDLLARAEGIVRLRREAQQKAAELIPAIFIDMFGDPATNPKGWPAPMLGDLIRVKSGEFLPAKAMNRNGTVAVFGGNGVNGRHDALMFESEQVVVGRVGEYCGNVHLAPPPCWITDNALYVSEFKRPLDVRFLVQLLRALRLREYRSQSGQPLISAARIYPVRSFYPPIGLQRAFAQRAEQAQGLVERQVTATQTAQSTFDALLSRAFR